MQKSRQPLENGLLDRKSDSLINEFECLNHSTFKAEIQQKRDQEDEFSFIENDSDAVLDLHENHNFLQKQGVKDIMSKKLTNLGYMLTINGSRAVDLAASPNREVYLFSDKFFHFEGKKFNQQFSNLLWLTYCQKFKPILIEKAKHLNREVKNLTTDNGWGCTIRCLQMLIANSLYYKQILTNPINNLNLFNNDKRGVKESAFSIQNVVEIGLKDYGIYPGEWYGINTGSIIFEQLNSTYLPVENFQICTFQDGNIELNRIQELAQPKSKQMSLRESAGQLEEMKQNQDKFGQPQDDLQQSLSFSFAQETLDQRRRLLDQQQKQNDLVEPAYEFTSSVLIIVSKRFGIDKIQPEYFPIIKKYMKMPSFVGLVGGLPRFAYYFVGSDEKVDHNLQSESLETFQSDSDTEEVYNEQTKRKEKVRKKCSDRLIFLDPHIVNPQTDPKQGYYQNRSQFHCTKPRSIEMSKLDPCMSFGFLIKDMASFALFENQISQGIQDDGDLAIFSLIDDLDVSMRSQLAISLSTFRSSYFDSK